MRDRKYLHNSHEKNQTVSLMTRRLLTCIYHTRYRRKYLFILSLFGFFCLIIEYIMQLNNEPTLILDNERHLFIRLFKENDLYRRNIRPFRILSGSLHYFRVLPQLWPDRIEKMKQAGLNTIETYIPWNLHEPERGNYKFNEGLSDLVSFLKLIHQHEMFTIIRPSGKNET